MFGPAFSRIYSNFDPFSRITLVTFASIPDTLMAVWREKLLPRTAAVKSFSTAIKPIPKIATNHELQIKSSHYTTIFV